MFWRSVPVRALALTAAPAPAATPTEAKRGTQVLTLVNNVRATHDLPKLKRNPCLQRFAIKRATYLANHQDTNLPHTPLGKIQKACKLGWVGENVLYGPFASVQMVQMWMSSPGHRSNILHRQFRITGVAIRKGGGSWWAAQVFGRKM
jgi:uncharacterized protein YkwD